MEVYVHFENVSKSKPKPFTELDFKNRRFLPNGGLDSGIFRSFFFFPFVPFLFELVICRAQSIAGGVSVR